jgi:lipopolysaccharide/colanic/teichoic acid biosynthesis glycosyltransferase
MLSRTKKRFYFSYGKRLLDLALTIPAVIVLSPVLIIAALMVRVRLGSPVLFEQERPGSKEKVFVVYKFRTMTNTRDNDGALLPDAQRMTRFGAILRKASIDELPELFNVLKGDMSLVGPRPLLVKYLPYYTSRERLRHSVRPGLTGLAQVSGRNYLPWDDRLEMDARYVEEISVCLDVKIIIQTFFQVIRAKNVAPLPGTVCNLLSDDREKQKQTKPS